jgi:hypothetical protein
MMRNFSIEEEHAADGFDRPSSAMGSCILGEFGTFDVQNYGDLLYPILFEKMFQQRNETRIIHKFSLMGSKSLQNSGYDTRPVGKLFSSRLGQPHTLIVGGGDLLRTDWDVMASHYRSLYLPRQKQSPLSGWLRLFKRRRNLSAETDRKFRRQHMNYPAVGPFIIEPGGDSDIKSVAYCSCGVPFPFDEQLKQRVAGAFDKSTFIYVRDHTSENALIQAGVTRKIHVAPDLIVTLSDFFDAAAERKKGRAVLQQRGVDIGRRILCFQSNPQSPDNSDELARQLKTYQARTGCVVALLPLGWCHGDREYLSQLAQDSRGAFKYIELDSIFDIIAVLAGCDVFLGTSLHGNITAFSFGIPHLFGPIPVVKCGGFIEMANLPPDLKLGSWAEINQKLDFAAGLGEEFLVARAIIAKQQVHKAFDLLFRTVRSV